MIWQAILSIVLAFILGELIKVIVQVARREPVVLFGMGGMPSTHTSSVVALMLAVYLETGWSLLLLVTVVFGIIVIRDAIGLRWEVTRHGIALNKLLRERSYARVGHRWLEILFGALLGAAVTLAVYLLF